VEGTHQNANPVVVRYSCRECRVEEDGAKKLRVDAKTVFAARPVASGASQGKENILLTSSRQTGKNDSKSENWPDRQRNAKRWEVPSPCD
jgi:hypothetical protein